MRFPLTASVTDTIGRVQRPRRKWPYSVINRGQSFVVRGGPDVVNSVRSAVSRFMRRNPGIYITSRQVRAGVLRFTRLT